MNAMTQTQEANALVGYISSVNNYELSEVLAPALVAQGLTLDIISRAACNGLNLKRFIKGLENGLDAALFVKAFNHGLDCQWFTLALESTNDMKQLNDIIDFSIRYDFEDTAGIIEFPANYFPTIACIRFSAALARQRSFPNS